MTTKTRKYMGQELTYREVLVQGKEDKYRRPLVLTFGKQSDATQETDEATGMIYWTGGAYFDMFINAWVSDSDFEEKSDEELIEYAKKKKLFE